MTEEDEKSPRGSSRQRSYDSRSRERTKDRKRAGSRDRKRDSRDSRDRYRDSSRSRHKSRDSRDRRDTNREREKKSDRSDVRNSRRSRSRSRSKDDRDRSESKSKSREDKKVAVVEDFSSKRKSENLKGSSSDPKRERWKPVEKLEFEPAAPETSFVAEPDPVIVRPPPPPLPPPRFLAAASAEQKKQEMENETKKTVDEQLLYYEHLMNQWNEEKNGATLARNNTKLVPFGILEKYCGNQVFSEMSQVTGTSTTRHQRKPASSIREIIRREHSHPTVEKSRSGEVKESPFPKETNISRMEVTPVKDNGPVGDLDNSLMTEGENDDLDLYGDLGNSLLVGDDDDDNAQEEKGDSHHDLHMNSLYGDLMGENEAVPTELASTVNQNNLNNDALILASEEEAQYKNQRNQAFESFMSSTLFPWSELPYLAQVMFLVFSLLS
jgi:hypothetical protein